MHVRSVKLPLSSREFYRVSLNHSSLQKKNRSLSRLELIPAQTFVLASLAVRAVRREKIRFHLFRTDRTNEKKQFTSSRGSFISAHVDK